MVITQAVALFWIYGKFNQVDIFNNSLFTIITLQ